MVKLKSNITTVNHPEIADIHSEKDRRNVFIDKAGAKNLNFPFLYKTLGEVRQISGEVDAFVSVEPSHKGVHMSRFIKIIGYYSNNILNFSEVSKLLRDLQNNLQEKNVHLSIKFKLLISKEAPITKQTGFVSYDCEYIGKKISKKTKIYLKVRVPVTTLCPGSKAVSTFGAHNQRGFIAVIVEAVEEVSFIDLIYYAEKFGASCEIFTNVKREDEKFMTEKAFQNAKFVEDSVRSVVEQLKYDKRFKGYYVSCQNMDSIHLHDTFAEVNKLIW